MANFPSSIKHRNQHSVNQSVAWSDSSSTSGMEEVSKQYEVSKAPGFLSRSLVMTDTSGGPSYFLESPKSISWRGSTLTLYRILHNSSQQPIATITTSKLSKDYQIRFLNNGWGTTLIQVGHNEYMFRGRKEGGGADDFIWRKHRMVDGDLKCVNSRTGQSWAEWKNTVFSSSRRGHLQVTSPSMKEAELILLTGVILQDRFRRRKAAAAGAVGGAVG